MQGIIYAYRTPAIGTRKAGCLPLSRDRALRNCMQLIRFSLLRELDPQEMEDNRNAAEQAECPFGMATNLKDRQSSQEGGLDGQAWTEGKGHTWSWGLGFTQSVEDEQDCRRGHVAVVGQNLMRDVQGETIQV